MNVLNVFWMFFFFKCFFLNLFYLVSKLFSFVNSICFTALAHQHATTAAVYMTLFMGIFNHIHDENLQFENKKQLVTRTFSSAKLFRCWVSLKETFKKLKFAIGKTSIFPIYIWLNMVWTEVTSKRLEQFCRSSSFQAGYFRHKIVLKFFGKLLRYGLN